MRVLNKSHLINHQILTFTLYESLQKSVLQNYILFLVIDTTLALDNPSRFRKNLLERI